MNPPSFSTVISSGLGSQAKNANAKPPTTDDFPALSSSSQSQGNTSRSSKTTASNQQQESGTTREEILISNLLGSSTGTASARPSTHQAKGSNATPGPSNIGSGIMSSGNMEFTSNPLTASLQNDSKTHLYKQPPSNNKSDAPFLKDSYGMLGMLDVVRMTNQDLSMLALGTDLTTLGLNLNGGENIYATFMTPFSDNPTVGAGGEPVYTLHSASLQSPPPLGKLKDFSDETMFYIFYAMPRDVLQEAAAQELYSRSWRFHKEFKLWLTKDPSNPDPIQKGGDFERGIYIFFDPATWTRVKLERILYFDHLEERVPYNLSNPVETANLNDVVKDLKKVSLNK